MKIVRLLAIILLLIGTATGNAMARDGGDRLDGRLDRKGERTAQRLDQRGDRIKDRYDSRAVWAASHNRPVLARRLHSRGHRIDARLDHRGDRIERRFDSRGDRLERRWDRRH